MALSSKEACFMHACTHGVNGKAHAPLAEVQGSRLTFAELVSSFRWSIVIDAIDGYRKLSRISRFAQICANDRYYRCLSQFIAVYRCLSYRKVSRYHRYWIFHIDKYRSQLRWLRRVPPYFLERRQVANGDTYRYFAIPIIDLSMIDVSAMYRWFTITIDR